jgi:hypothetical protein
MDTAIFPLTADGVDGECRLFQRKQLQQRRDRGDLIGLRRHLGLAGHETLAASITRRLYGSAPWPHPLDSAPQRLAVYGDDVGAGLGK